jgi:hypothetical protein
MFPALRETMVSAYRLFAAERIYSSSSPDIQGQRNRIFSCKIVLFFIFHVVTILWMAVGIVAVYNNVYYNYNLKKADVRKSCSMDVRMRNAQKDPEGKPAGIRPLWRHMHKG